MIHVHGRYLCPHKEKLSRDSLFHLHPCVCVSVCVEIYIPLGRRELRKGSLRGRRDLKGYKEFRNGVYVIRKREGGLEESQLQRGQG